MCIRDRGRTARATPIRLKSPITITFFMWIWKTSTSPMSPFTSWAKNSYPCTLCICRRWETDPTFSRNPADVYKRQVYGYLMDEDENFIIDEEAAPVVKQIYNFCLAGNGPTKIARMLTEQQLSLIHI